MSEKYNIVSRPAHYTAGRQYEPIAVIEDWELGFCLGNAVKYISRAGRKDKSKEIEDLEKAIWYIQRHIRKLELSEVTMETVEETSVAKSLKEVFEHINDTVINKPTSISDQLKSYKDIYYNDRVDFDAHLTPTVE